MKKLKNRRSLLTLALALVFLVSLGGLLYDQAEYRLGESVYDEASALAGLDSSKLSDIFFQTLPEDPETPEQPEENPAEEPPAREPIPWQTVLSQVNLSALRAVNDDVLGWIMIPGTAVSYPYVQAGDNDYYLRRTWKGGRNRAGCIMMECTNSPDRSDFHTILYGHNLRNGAMFSCLPNFQRASYWRSHPSIYLVDDSGTHRYDIFSVRKVGLQDITYRLDLERSGLQEDFIRAALENSLVNTGIVPAAQDHILTLSTCTNVKEDVRWVVHAVLYQEPAETQPEDEATPPEGETTPPENETAPPEGETTPPEGETTPPEGETTPPEGETTPPEGEITLPEGETASPEGETTPPEGETAPPEDGEAPAAA